MHSGKMARGDETVDEFVLEVEPSGISVFELVKEESSQSIGSGGGDGLAHEVIHDPGVVKLGLG